MADNYIDIVFDGSTTEDGQTGISSNSSNYSFVSQKIYTWVPIKITAVKLYIRADQTYNCYIDIVGSFGAATNTAIVVEESVSVSGAPKWVTFTPSSPIILMPGQYWVSLESGGAVSWQYDGEDWIECGLFYAWEMYFGTSANASSTLPIVFVAYKSTVSLA